MLYQVIFNALLEKIEDGTYPPGSRLPSEKELAEQYNVSRITSKKALEMLVERNRITRMPGKGSFVLESWESDAPIVATVAPGSVDRNLIGVVIDHFGAAFGDRIIYGIENECRQRGLNMILKFTYGSIDEETKALDELISLNVQGIILMCVQGENYNDKVLKLFIDKFPIILIDREMPGLPIPSVITDNYSATKTLMNVLIKEGHRSICFLSHHYYQSSTVTARFSAYLDSMLEHGLITNEELWLRDLDASQPKISDDDDTPVNIERIKKFIGEHPHVTGFFAINQPIGIMVYKILKSMGLEKEREVVFFDEVEEESNPNPIFTHILQGEFMIGTMAVKYLCNLIKGKEIPQRNYVPYTLVMKQNI